MRSSQAHPGKFNPVVGIAITLVAIAIIVVVVVATQGGGASRLTPFPTMAYLESPQNYLGNQYQIDAQVDSMLSYEPGVGRLLVVRSESKPIPVFLPDGLIDSIHTGQRYRLSVSIGDGGLIYINDLEKY